MQLPPCPCNLYACTYRLTYKQLNSRILLRSIHDDGRTRLSNIWIPTGGITPPAGTVEDTPSKLIRGGYVRQAHSGFFHLLPLGLRVQEKLERLIDKHMSEFGASKVSLSSFSAPELWKKSGRYKDDNPELFQLRDRKGARFLLSPTHEEEITTLASGIINSYKQLPLWLYQISRKYRDEPRPRQGLLRTREFVMKDLYTFDANPDKAANTYQKVRQAYNSFFNELRIPFLVAKAHSGDMGGSRSHEYHIVTASGEDTVISCSSCNLAYNEEVVLIEHNSKMRKESAADLGPYQSWFGISRDRCHLVEVVVPQFLDSRGDHGLERKEVQVNTFLIRSQYPDLDLSIERPLHTFVEYWEKQQSPVSGRDWPAARSLPRLTLLHDYRVPQEYVRCRESNSPTTTLYNRLFAIIGSRPHQDSTSLDLARRQDGDECFRCKERSLKVQQAVELAHTFDLGQRYSKPLDAKFIIKPVEQGRGNALTQQDRCRTSPARQGYGHFYMGCHGIGISRIIAAVAESLADAQGLIWPRAMAPYEAVILATKAHEAVAKELWDLLTRQDPCSAPVDAVLDDRDKGFGWKLKDADLLGFPIVIILGATFTNSELCEVSVRRLGTCQNVSVAHIRDYIARTLERL